MRALVVVAGAAALIALAAGDMVPASGQDVLMIRPGRALGPIEIGMPIDRAREILQGWGTIEPYDGPLGRGVCNPEDGVGACVFERWARLNAGSPGRVVFVLTDDARFATEPGGHKVGTPLLGLLRTFGLYTASADAEVLWDNQGLMVDVRASDSGLIVGLIGVYTPRATASMIRRKIN